jgi:hypothetical protein
VSKVRTAKAVRLGAAVVLALAVAACGHPKEQALVDQFFSASRLRDKTAAQTVSTVFFDPKDQGLVRDFTIDSVGAEEQDESGVTTKSVRLSASVESPEGLTSKKTIFVTMQRRPGAAWMITGVMVAVPAPPPSRDPSAPPR